MPACVLLKDVAAFLDGRHGGLYRDIATLVKAPG